MKAKKGFVIASTVFIGINLVLFFALWIFVTFWNKMVSTYFLKWVEGVNTDSDFGYWLYNSVNENISVIILLLIIILFLIIAAKLAIFYNFIKYSKYGIKDFYTRRSKYLAMSILQIFLVGSFFGMICGITAIVIQKAIVTPNNVSQVLNDTWGQEEEMPIAGKNANDNRPVVRVGPNARFVENISQLRDGVRYLFEAKLISNAQKNSLNKKIDKLSKDKARKKEFSGRWKIKEA